MPRKLYVSGNRAPHLSGPPHDPDRESPSIAELPEGEFWACFERRYGANPDLASPHIRRYILPLLRADFQLVVRLSSVPIA
jgi:surfactin synthase thioesterase subunit